ncbi:MAG: histidine phosphatase family protein [Candidatus Obscuribacterales bacterium]|nr:histidine phosphatase family protein [Candidatus Obscuribacterales bacterium]
MALLKKEIIALASIALCIFSTSTAQGDSEGKMVFAVDVIRHGDRGPIKDLASAPHKWPQGLGQLTPEGMNQEFQLGKRFHDRYIAKEHLLPEKFDVDTMYVRASDIDRTLMSAECTLLGLYPMGTGPTTDAGTEGAPARFQPIPIHTRPRDMDDLLIPDANKDVPKIYDDYVFNTSEWKDRIAKESVNFERWGKLAGYPITTPRQMSGLGDAIFIRKTHHVAMPEGMTDDDAKKMMDFGEWVFAETFKPAEVGQATGGNLLRAIAKYLDESSKNKADAKLKYVLFSAHDSTISAVLSAMNPPVEIRPPYSSDLNFALLKNGDQYSVKVTLNDVPVDFPGSTNGISSLEKFAALAPAQSTEKSQPRPATDIK